LKTEYIRKQPDFPLRVENWIGIKEASGTDTIEAVNTMRLGDNPESTQRMVKLRGQAPFYNPRQARVRKWSQSPSAYSS
jgi:hypothetical protein